MVDTFLQIPLWNKYENEYFDFKLISDDVAVFKYDNRIQVEIIYCDEIEFFARERLRDLVYNKEVLYLNVSLIIDEIVIRSWGLQRDADLNEVEEQSIIYSESLKLLDPVIEKITAQNAFVAGFCYAKGYEYLKD